MPPRRARLVLIFLSLPDVCEGDLLLAVFVNVRTEYHKLPPFVKKIIERQI